MPFCPSLRIATMMAILLAPAVALANPFEIRVRDHRFVPDVVEVPAGQKIKLIVHNDDDEPEEFESYDLNREKIIRPGRSVTIFLPPMEPGEYTFFGEFHPETAQGRIIAK
ncbi:MAG: cupredoxin domain-containing protein [Nitrospirota bacterium]|nr:cupredoxin domain-containing protein [Nitrospirota bacterium]